jgi:hypothetical protein
VDDIACSSTPTKEHAFGVDDNPPHSRSPFPFPVHFSAWVSSAKRYWVIFAKHRSADLAGGETDQRIAITQRVI